jgi:hypothetical protein
MFDSTKYYHEHPEARKKKALYDKAINRRPEQIRKREESNLQRAHAKKEGKNIRGKDYDHAVNRFVPSKTNRGRTGEGGRKKGVGH